MLHTCTALRDACTRSHLKVGQQHGQQLQLILKQRYAAELYGTHVRRKQPQVPQPAVVVAATTPARRSPCAAAGPAAAALHGACRAPSALSMWATHDTFAMVVRPYIQYDGRCRGITAVVRERRVLELLAVTPCTAHSCSRCLYYCCSSCRCRCCCSSCPLLVRTSPCAATPRCGGRRRGWRWRRRRLVLLLAVQAQQQLQGSSQAEADPRVGGGH